MSSTLQDLFSEIIHSKRERDLTIDLIEELSQIPRRTKAGIQQFATFTAVPGSPVSEQVHQYRLGSRYGGGGSVVSGRRSKAPKIIDDTLARDLADAPEVPEGHIRQYFCYDDNDTGRIAAVVDMSSKHFDTSFTSAGLRTEFAMRREKKFHLKSMESHLKEQIKNHEELMDKSRETLLSGSGGKVRTLGLEMFSSSLTDPNSVGGFLITGPGSDMTQVKYCPWCIEGLLARFEAGDNRIAHPPIPKTNLILPSHCPENIHRDVGEGDCINFPKVAEKIASSRIKMGYNDINIVEFQIQEIPEDCQALWIDVSSSKR